MVISKLLLFSCILFTFGAIYSEPILNSTYYYFGINLIINFIFPLINKFIKKKYILNKLSILTNVIFNITTIKHTNTLLWIYNYPLNSNNIIACLLWILYNYLYNIVYE